VHNPYFNVGPNLMNSATKMFLIAPANATDLPQVCKSIRIWNPEATPQTVHFTTVSGDSITITVPANSVWTEPAVISQVQATGTGVTLVIHGYSD
jgi:hypothetical protein